MKPRKIVKRYTVKGRAKGFAKYMESIKGDKLIPGLFNLPSHDELIKRLDSIALLHKKIKIKEPCTDWDVYVSKMIDDMICPFCGYSQDCIMPANAETMKCHSCGKESKINEFKGKVIQ